MNDYIKILEILAQNMTAWDFNTLLDDTDKAYKRAHDCDKLIPLVMPEDLK